MDVCDPLRSKRRWRNEAPCLQNYQKIMCTSGNMTCFTVYLGYKVAWGAIDLGHIVSLALHSEAPQSQHWAADAGTNLGLQATQDTQSRPVVLKSSLCPWG